MKNILLDSGPMIALFNKKDKHHITSTEFIKTNKSILITTEPNITETMYVLDINLDAQTDFLTWIGNGAVKVISLVEKDYKRCVQLIKKYSDLPMDFADAAMVTILEKLNTKEIATFDNHFDIYRYKNRSRFNNVLS